MRPGLRMYCTRTSLKKYISDMYLATDTPKHWLSIYSAFVKDAGFDVELEDVSTVDPAASAAKIHAADAFAVGSPTLNRDALKPIWDVLTSISTYIVKDKIAAVFGSFGWSGESIKYLSERLRSVGADVVGTCSAKLRPDEKEIAEAEKLGKAICDALS